VVTLVLTLMVQVACLAALLTADHGWLGLVTAVVSGRVAMARIGLPGVAAAEGSTLGRLVTGTVSPRWLFPWGLVVAALVTVGTAGDPVLTWRLIAAAVAGPLAAEPLYRRAITRLGGVTGDVMGAMNEVSTAATLLVAAVLVS
jgi:cobalamin synthase